MKTSSFNEVCSASEGVTAWPSYTTAPSGPISGPALDLSTNSNIIKSQQPVVDLGHHDSSHVTSLVDMKFETLLSASLLFFLLIIILFTTNVFVKLL